jgi:hypothetical protein
MADEGYNRMEASKMTSEMAGGQETGKIRKAYHAPELMNLGAIPAVVRSGGGPGTDVTPFGNSSSPGS